MIGYRHRLCLVCIRRLVAGFGIERFDLFRLWRLQAIASVLLLTV